MKKLIGVASLCAALCLGLAHATVYAGTAYDDPAAAIPEVTADALVRRQATSEKLLVIDVRSAEDFAKGHVPGAINLAHDTITGREPVLSGWTNEAVVLYCHSGRRSGIAAKVLKKQGYMKLEHLQGDYPGWEKSGRPVERQVPQ